MLELVRHLHPSQSSPNDGQSVLGGIQVKAIFFVLLGMHLSTFSALAQEANHDVTAKTKEARLKNEDIVGRAGQLIREKKDGEWVYSLRVGKEIQGKFGYSPDFREVRLASKDAEVMKSLEALFADEKSDFYASVENIELNVVLSKDGKKDDLFTVQSIVDNRAKIGDRFLPNHRYSAGVYSVRLSGFEEIDQNATDTFFKAMKEKGFISSSWSAGLAQKNASKSGRQEWYMGTSLRTELSRDELRKVLGKIELPESVKLSRMSSL